MNQRLLRLCLVVVTAATTNLFGAQPPSLAYSSGPVEDPLDDSVWPNRHSHANGDAWLMKNHDRLEVMRPRVLVLNFSNQAKPMKNWWPFLFY